MTHADYGISALMAWREDRGGGVTGMTAVLCALRNRVTKHHSTPFAEVTKKWAFSSMTNPGDPQLVLYPIDTDTNWQQAQLIAGNVLDGLTTYELLERLMKYRSWIKGNKKAQVLVAAFPFSFPVLFVVCRLLMFVGW